MAARLLRSIFELGVIGSVFIMVWDFSNWIVGLGFFCLCLVWFDICLACVFFIEFDLV